MNINKLNIIYLVLSDFYKSNKVINIDLRNEAALHKAYINFKMAGRYCAHLKLKNNFMRMFIVGNEVDLSTPKNFMEFMMDWEVLEYLQNAFARMGKTLKIKYPADAYINEISESNKFYREAAQRVVNFDKNVHIFNTEEDVFRFISLLDDPHDIYNYFFCRSVNGDQPVMMIMNGTRDEYGNPIWDDRRERHAIMAQYKKYLKNVDYLEARECRAEYWLDNPKYRFEPDHNRYNRNGN